MKTNAVKKSAPVSKKMKSVKKAAGAVSKSVLKKKSASVAAVGKKKVKTDITVKVRKPVAKVKAKVKSAAKPVAKAARMTKTQWLNEIATKSDMPMRDVKAVITAYEDVVMEQVQSKSGEFMHNGMFKVSAVHVPAKKARKGINPFTKEETVFKAKPATTKLKIRPLALLKKSVM